MEIAVQNNNINIDLLTKIKSVTEMCKLARFEQILSNCLENMPNTSPIDYVGELNQNDIMH